MKVRSAKGLLTRRMNEVEMTLEEYTYNNGEPTTFHVETFKQHLVKVRAARDVVHTAYSNLMSINVPIMVKKQMN